MIKIHTKDGKQIVFIDEAVTIVMTKEALPNSSVICKKVADDCESDITFSPAKTVEHIKNSKRNKLAAATHDDSFNR